MTPLTLLHVFPSFDVGGQQTRFVTIANRLGRTMRHHLLSLDGRDDAVALLDPKLDFELLPQPPATPDLLRRMHRIVAICRANNYDALVTYNWGAIEFAMANRWFVSLPHIHFEDGFGPDEALRQKRRRVFVRKLVLPRSDLVVPSHRLEEIASRSWRLASHRVTYIPNGIDPQRFDDISASGAPFFDRQHGECVIGSFSPLRREKNLSRLLNLFAGLPPLPLRTRLVLCGDGAERSVLMHEAVRLGIADRITFTGHVPRPEMVMGAFDIFAITSDTEQMPYAVLEAMAARLPVLATDVGDIVAMVSEQNRPFVIPPADPTALTAGLAQLCRDLCLRRQIGRANRTKVQRQFDVDSMAKAFQRVLLRIVPPRR